MDWTVWFKYFALLFENPSHTDRSDHIILAFITLLNMMLVLSFDCNKTLLALKLVVELSPMLDIIVEPLALIDLLKEGWVVSSVESDFAEVTDDDFVPGLSKINRINWFAMNRKDFLFVCGTHFQQQILGQLRSCSIVWTQFYISCIWHLYLLVLRLTSPCTVPDWASFSENRSSSFLEFSNLLHKIETILFITNITLAHE